MVDASEKKLNPEQIKAVQHGEGPLLIIAGAGTGKTTVIVERIKHLIVEKKVSPSEILALTFTEKAAREMEERVDVALPLGYANLWISTFHGFADRVLRDEALNIGLNSHYRIMTQAENIHFLRQNLFKLDLDYFRPLGNPNKFVEGLLQHFSRLKDEDVVVEEYFQYLKRLKKEKKLKKNEKVKENQEDLEEISRTEELAKAYQKYEELKFKEGFFDFGDLMSELLRLFRTRPKILKTYREKFKYILVDEFQDTNYAQYMLVKLLSPPPKSNLTVVGDDNQSIYKFRGAAISNILQFKKEYPEAQSVVLNQNYRSSQTILDAAYRLIKNNDPDTLEASLGISKKLKKVREVSETPVEFWLATRVDKEAEMVAAEIKRLSEDYQYRDFAILVRANNHAEPFIRALGQAGIPAQFLGPGTLFREPEIKDLIAYLSVLCNFEDTVAMYRLLSMENFGLSGRDLASLLNFSRKHRISLFEACEEIVVTKSKIISATALETVGKLVRLIQKHLGLMKTASAYEILLLFLQESGLYARLSDIKTVEDEKRVQNIAKFFDKLKVYEADHEDASVLTMVDYFNLSLELGESPLAAETDWTENNAVNLLTVHSAKGLEFPIVFMVNLVNRRFPPTERPEPIPIPEALIKEILPQGDSHLEEERRLFYVGMTRARDRLYFTAANFYGEGKQERKISPFVIEALGEEVLTKSRSGERKENQLSIFDLKTVAVKRGPMVRQPISQLSYSQIETFVLCPLKYRYAYILFLPTPPSAALSFGSTIHETLRDFYQRALAGQNPTKNDLLKILAENWVTVGFSSKEQQQRYKKQGEKILSEFFEKSYQPKSLPLALEQSFALRIGSSLRVLGKIDRIDQGPKGIEIIDYKTGKLTTKKEVEKDLQLSLYALVATEGILTLAGVLKQIPKPEEVVVSFYFFDNQEKVSSSRTREDLERVKEELLEKAKTISESNFSPTPGKHCDFCEFRLLCEAWK